ncbi:peptidase S24/S26A/S26B/S26C [Phaeosphaeriaceae sp. PMI808]|nr:peptidase S24/S26A/S26B/S26C [Phaeosphaeriaceae sp. PMI808]
MPPKIPVRIKLKPPPIPKSRPAPLPTAKYPKSSSREAPKPPLSSNTQSAPPPPPPSWREHRTFRFATRMGGYYVLLICAGIWTRDHYLHYTTVQGVSMAPTINPTAHETGERDWILVHPYFHKAAKKQQTNGSTTSEEDDTWGVKRGDVVTFWKPHKPEELGIKRVVAIEGDTVYPKRGYVLDASVLARQRLHGMPDGLASPDPDSVASAREEGGRIVVPYGHIWVEGDNSRMSLDSRDYGPISKGLVEGKAVWTWRGWTEIFRTGDARSVEERGWGSRVVKGRSEIPPLFLE